MTTNRISSIDWFRGFAILTMVLANYMGGVALIPAWLKHAPDVGLTVIDLIAPFFIFAIGLTFGLFWLEHPGHVVCTANIGRWFFLPPVVLVTVGVLWGLCSAAVQSHAARRT